MAGKKNSPIYISGPCVIESAELLEQVAQEIVRIRDIHGIDIISKLLLTRLIALPYHRLEVQG